MTNPKEITMDHYQTDRLDLRRMDCIDCMAKMDANSIDLTVTSPPYDNLRTYEGSLQWNEDTWKQVLKGLYRVTKQGGVVVWVVGDATIKGSETGTSFKQALYAIEIGLSLYDTMIYRKTNKPPLNSPRYEQEFEYMFIFSKGRPKSINLLSTGCKYAGKINNGTARNSGRDELVKKQGAGKPCKDEKPLGNIWSFPVGCEKDNAGRHPAIFPEKLAQDHIFTWSNKGDTVFDPFTGSGTTGKMAMRLGRKFIGCEKVQEYYDIAKDRIERETAQVDMFTDGMAEL